jgi:hypothetical protein
MAEGYESEQDLFVVRACFDMMLRSEDLSKTRTIRSHFAHVKDSSGAESPLLNFLDFLLEAIELDDFKFVANMANVDYKPVLARDPVLFNKVDGICQKYFEQTIKPENPMQKMLQ